MLAWQWDDGVIPYWRGAGRARRQRSACARLCLELHGQQNVYNVAHLRTACAMRSGRWSASISIRATCSGWAPTRSRRSARSATRSIMFTPRTRGSIRRSAPINGLIDVTPNERLAERAWSLRDAGRTATTCCGGGSSARCAASRRLRRRAVDRARGSPAAAPGRRPPLRRAAAWGCVLTENAELKPADAPGVVWTIARSARNGSIIHRSVSPYVARVRERPLSQFRAPTRPRSRIRQSWSLSQASHRLVR